MGGNEVGRGGRVVLAEPGGEEAGERVLLARGVFGSAWGCEGALTREQDMETRTDAGTALCALCLEVAGGDL